MFRWRGVYCDRLHEFAIADISPHFLDLFAQLGGVSSLGPLFSNFLSRGLSFSAKFESFLLAFSYVLKEVTSRRRESFPFYQSGDVLNLLLIDYLLSVLFQAEKFSSGAVWLRSVNISKFGSTPSCKLLVWFHFHCFDPANRLRLD